MNLYSLLYSIQNLKETMDRATAAENNYLDQDGNHNMAYAYGRYIGTVKGMSRSIDMLVAQIKEIENLKAVISMFRLDDPDVVRRINALSQRQQGAFEEELVELLESYELLEDPKPEPEDEEDEEEN